jgi:hypothetical protein
MRRRRSTDCGRQGACSKAGVGQVGVDIEKVVFAKLFRGRGKVGVMIVPAMTAGVFKKRGDPDPYYNSRVLEISF